MPQVSVIIPNFNGLSFLPGVLDSLREQTQKDLEVIVVDNGSQDGSLALLKEKYPQVRVLALEKNFGFAAAVNKGIQLSSAPFFILLNNDTQVEPTFVQELLEGIGRHEKAFSCEACMMQLLRRDLLDGAGDYYCALGWAFARGKGKEKKAYQREEPIFSSCAGAAIYRRAYFDHTGGFDETHFAYLEDLDLCYRAKRMGYENWYLPRAVVYHLGSGTSGSRHNPFKTRYAARNNLFLLYKNQPLWQLLLNLPLILLGHLIKLAYFSLRGLGGAYLKGVGEGLALCKGNRKKRGPFPFLRTLSIQGELYFNLLRPFL